MVANVAVELGKTADRCLVDKYLGYGMHRLAEGLGQLFLADVLGPHVHVSVTFDHLGAFQALGELEGMDTKGTTGTTVNHHEHETSLLKWIFANWRAMSVHNQPRQRCALVRSAEPVFYQPSVCFPRSTTPSFP